MRCPFCESNMRLIERHKRFTKEGKPIYDLTLECQCRRYYYAAAQVERVYTKEDGHALTAELGLR